MVTKKNSNFLYCIDLNDFYLKSLNKLLFSSIKYYCFLFLFLNQPTKMETTTIVFNLRSSKIVKI